MSNNKKNEVFIDIDAILESKAPSLKKKLPRFLINYLKKIAHQDDLNEFFSLFGHLQGQDFAQAILDHYHVSVKVEGEENLPENGRVIFASNHPLGGMDGVAILNFLSRKYGAAKAPVNDILMNVKQLNNFFIPINKLGGQSKDSSVMINETYQSDTPILFFPAGVCSRKQSDGSIRDLDWKKTFIAKSVQYQRDVVPLSFVGRNSSFFYNLAYWRKKLGVKANIEMLYLVDEFYKHRNSTFSIRIGKPIAWETFDKSKSPAQWAEWVKDIVYGNF